MSSTCRQPLILSKCNPFRVLLITLLTVLAHIHAEEFVFNSVVVKELIDAKDMEDIQSEIPEAFSPANFYTLSLGKKHSLAIVDTVEQIRDDGKTVGFVALTCMDKKMKPCYFGINITDFQNKVVYFKENIDSITLMLTFKMTGDYYFNFINKDNKDKKLTVGIECINCEKEKSNLVQEAFYNKEHYKEKIDRIGQLNRMIGAMMLLTTNSKKVVGAFTRSRLS